LMRPTVLRTPEIAAAQTKKEESRLPGISQAATEEEIETRRAELAEQRQERIEMRKAGLPGVPQSGSIGTNAVASPESKAAMENTLPPDQTEQTQNQPAPSRSSSGNNLFQPVTPEGFVETNTTDYPNR